MEADYRGSHLSQDKGESYHRAFIEKPYRRMVWQLEKTILDRIMKTFYACTDVNHLDFACGTGRVLLYLEDQVFTSVGVDLSPGMLAIAHRNRKRCELFQADLTRDDVLGNRKFNLITAFRFFPNAQPGLRTEAMQVLVKHLDNNGYLVFNNHKNRGSAMNRIYRLAFGGLPEGMSIAEVKELLAKNGIEIVQIYHLCVLPISEKHMLFPASLLYPIESFLSKCKFFQKYGQNLIFVCRRSTSKFK